MLQVVLLAAGKSLRFNGIKQLALLQGRTLLEHVVSQYFENNALLSPINRLNVVIGANAEQITAQINPPLNWFFAANWQQGMGSSLADFVNQLEQHTAHLFIGLADQVALQTADIKTLLKVHQRFPDAIITAQYDDIMGAPTIFPRQFFAQLAYLRGDKGAKQILYDNEPQVIKVAMSNAKFDIDTQQDWHWAQQNLTRANTCD